MRAQDDGRVPAAPGSREPGSQAIPAASGFDPSRDDAWGPEIVVNGVRPEWLGEQEPFVWVRTIRWLDHFKSKLSYAAPFVPSTRQWGWKHTSGAPCIRAIRLPADHPAYSRDSGRSPEGEDSRSEAECEASQSGDAASGASPNPCPDQDTTP
jgi:hypothetical protein